MARGIDPHLRNRPWLALLRHRRRWFTTSPASPEGLRITEDGAQVRLLEDGVTERVTEGAF